MYLQSARQVHQCQQDKLTIHVTTISKQKTTTMKTQSTKAAFFSQRIVSYFVLHSFCPLLAVLALASLPAVRANTSVTISPERAGHTGTLLPSGQVLIAGGVN